MLRSLLMTGLVVGSASAGAAAQAQPAPAVVEPPTFYYAVVNFDGTMARSTRRAKSQKLGTGQYSVVVKANVSKCAYSVTVGSPGTTPEQGGSAKVASLGGNVNGVFIGTGQQGSPADRSFHLIVLCP
jgi:hypothetical protein